MRVLTYRREVAAVAALYASLGKRYNRHLLFDCAYQSPSRVAKAVLAWLGAREPRAGGRWLELGAGTGLVGRALAKSGIAIDLVALDITAELLVELPWPPYVACALADVTAALPFEGEAFDGALAVGLVEHIEHPGRLFASLRPRLRQGALLAVTHVPATGRATELFEPDARLLAHDAAHFDSALLRGGYVIETSETFPAYQSRGQWIEHRLVLASATA